jgi:hypothetical protein
LVRGQIVALQKKWDEHPILLRDDGIVARPFYVQQLVFLAKSPLTSMQPPVTVLDKKTKTENFCEFPPGEGLYTDTARHSLGARRDKHHLR